VAVVAAEAVVAVAEAEAAEAVERRP
jgi:hypothetical protein